MTQKGKKASGGSKKTMIIVGIALAVLAVLTIG